MTTAAVLDRRAFPADAVIFAAGEPARNAFLIQAGTVRIVGADSRSIATLGAGELFGEMGIVDGGARSATAIAASHVTCIALEPQELEQRLKASDPLVRMMVERLTQRLRKTTGGSEVVAYDQAA